MTPLQRHVEELGGLARTSELHAFGLGRNRIAAAVSDREIDRIRQGWFGNPWLPALQRQAARVGGQLGCSSAASALGLWEPRFEVVHVAVEPGSRALRAPDDRRARLQDGQAVIHWSGTDPAGSRTIVSVPRCVQQVARCESPVVALTVAESALHRRLLSTPDLQALVRALPGHLRPLLSRASGASESGTETVFVHRMAELGVIVRQQVSIPGVGRVDGLIGRRLVIELDSFAHHRDAAKGRERDAKLSALGYRVLRFMYVHVMEQWPVVRDAVLAAIARGDHL